MAKHAARQFILARLVFSSAAAVLVALVGWIAVRVGGEPGGAGDPLMVQPPAALQVAGGALPAPSTESASLTASPSAPVSASASPTPSRSASAKPAPSKSASRTPSAAPSRTSPSPTAGPLAVTYSNSASWRDGFIAAVKVVNNGSAASEWSVTLTYPSSADFEVRATWNAAVSASGDSVTLSGKSLDPGSSITAGFQVTKAGGDVVKPVTCSIGGGSCLMS
ncbi:cellulose binding domain-containing protein [Actinoplanes sp. NEAU-A12]|uniref:Cellulose binding domain-containing protein n=1 Tax=Actinoplanes sandaracinus TaxID=3045177 RepID=A0ABT6X092_9ACTN|nr:cellulose binding domain-containing protein [Actinoplanes sandaracinus]MDI6105334.1 cellulose binding domain-containing protein [Actinoplanes sandaracinus]